MTKKNHRINNDITIKQPVIGTRMSVTQAIASKNKVPMIPVTTPRPRTLTAPDHGGDNEA